MQQVSDRQDPITIQTAILLKIQQRLETIENLAEDEVAQGKVFPYNLVLGVSATRVDVESDIKYKAFSFTIRNDGANPIYYGVNDYPITTTPINPREVVTIDFHRAKISYLTFVSTGATTARLTVVY